MTDQGTAMTGDPAGDTTGESTGDGLRAAVWSALGTVRDPEFAAPETGPDNESEHREQRDVLPGVLRARYGEDATGPAGRTEGNGQRGLGEPAQHTPEGEDGSR